MGYLIDQIDSNFHIGAEHLDRILKEVLLLITPDAKEKNGAGGSIWRGKNIPIEKHYAWVDEERALNAKTFKEVAEAFRWDMWVDDAGDVYNIMFRGEKYGGDEMVFLNVLAPYVQKDSYIEMRGEEGELWKWYFDGETCKEHHANVQYPTLEEGDILCH